MYHQIYLQLRDEILSGQRPTGSALPTEQELSEIYAVSRITARRVLTELAQQHFVERKRRLGTRVIFQSPATPMEANIDQAVDSLLAFGRRTPVTVIEVATENPSAIVASALKIDPTDQVIRAVRVRSMDGEPLGYIVSYVPAALGDVITTANLAKAPILKILEEAGHRAVQAEQTISAMQADAVISQALNIESRSALLRIARTTYDKDHKPFLLTFAHYRADKFTIRLDLQHPGGATLTPTITQG
ncbi:GntR family transcriptional regulator [Sphingobium boeckii]|uniref:GntR family transcriptional regulator n=1 Tax=Sphingobium boeckii TaxID=1082345 RepID=A0A7W9ALI1_9SPHN|nr:GntR family transcriptional regulator [Sphingobium boeckii]MBB5687701.1 GntR family transcriptional regulator [Sphingobium boeckii]